MNFAAAPNRGNGTSAPQSEQKAPPRLLFVCLTNNVGGGERTIGEMASKGAICAVLSPPNYYCQETQFSQRRYLLPQQFGVWFANLFVWPALEVISRTWRPDLVLPLDDIAASLLMGLAISSRTSARLRTLLLRSLGNTHGYQPASSRAGLMGLANQIGIKHPASRSVDDTRSLDETMANVGYPVVVKRESTCGGCGVSVAADKEALKRAISIRPWRLLPTGLVRHLAKQIVWSAAGQLQLPSDLIQLQGFVRGRLAVRTVAAWQGQELEGVSFLAECVHPSPTGSSTVVTPVEHGEMEATTKRLVAALGCSGIVSFDFILEDATQDAYLIEMNPRPIGLTHLGRLFGRDVCRALLEQLGWKPPTDRAWGPPPTAVALFPKEMQRDLNSAWLRRPGTLHDVPWEDFALIATYTRPRGISAERTTSTAMSVESEPADPSPRYEDTFGENTRTL